MKKFKFTISGNPYDVEIQKFENNVAKLEVNGTTYKVEVHKEVKQVSKTPKLVRPNVQTKRKDTKIKKSMQGITPIKAPLPGTILKIMVKEGDEVKQSDNLLIMEAMKMENQVLAERAGKIKSIKVAEGDAVLQNDVLIEIV